MAGLFGLFGGNKDQDPTPKDAFFLDDESAKSMGDTSYMKESKSIRRTYPGVAGQPEFEVIKTVSSNKSSVNDSRKDVMPKRAESTTSSYTSSYTPATSFSSASSFGGTTPSYSAPAPTPSYSAPEPTPAPAPAVVAPVASPSVSDAAVQKRRQSDDGMDMFRSMAKKIGK